MNCVKVCLRLFLWVEEGPTTLAGYQVSGQNSATASLSPSGARRVSVIVGERGVETALFADKQGHRSAVTTINALRSMQS
eukprot:775847-Pleurochrysis_carterae.AAC.1